MFEPLDGIGASGGGQGQLVELALRELAGPVLEAVAWFEALDRLPQDDVAYMRIVLANKQKLTQKPTVRLSTIHGAKGGEAEHVVLSREIAQRTWREMERWPDDERRVWYVGVTRAREQLTLLDATTPRSSPWL
jgi:superfamily I DNA/RNA helicase